MTKIRAEFFADLRDKVGCAFKDLEFKGRTVLDLIIELDETTGGNFMRHVMEGGRLKELFKVLVNGKDIRGLNGLSTEISGGDVVSFFPPVAGG